MRPGLPALLVLASLAAPGCGIKSTVHLVAAQRAVHRAEERGATENAVYEYTLATRYLEKAREESAHARYGDAIRLARESEAFADKAVIVMQEKGLGADDGTSEPTPTQPAPVVMPVAAPAPGAMPTPSTTPDPAPEPLEPPPIEPAPPTYRVGDPAPEPAPEDATP